MSPIEIYIVSGFLIFVAITVSITIAFSNKNQSIEKPNPRIYNIWEERKEVSKMVKNQFDQLLKQQKQQKE
jgi:hypothetical protein